MAATDFDSNSSHGGGTMALIVPNQIQGNREWFEQTPYSDGPQTTVKLESLGTAALGFPQGASPAAAGLSGEIPHADEWVISPGLVSSPAPTGQRDGLQQAPSPGGEGCLVKLARLGKLIFGGEL